MSVCIPSGQYVFCGSMLVRVTGSKMLVKVPKAEYSVDILVADEVEGGWHIKFVRNSVPFEGLLKAV